MVMTGCWVTCCSDLSAGFVTYMKVSVEEDDRGEEWVLKRQVKRHLNKDWIESYEPRTKTALTIPL